jgi:hypothetical protein
MYLALLALTVVMAPVSSDTITLPLSWRTSNNSGLDVPLTDWFSRTDNQVRRIAGLSLCCMRSRLTTFPSGTLQSLSVLRLRSCESVPSRKEI